MQCNYNVDTSKHLIGFVLIFLLSLISWPGMIDNDPDIGVCMSWEEENPPEDVPPVS